MENGKAYIYIMTNKTFEGHNWVKIGYAKDPEKRAKQLSSTNIIFPYKVYATYEIPESDHMGDKVLHKIITNLNPNLRLTENREFFEMTPEQAYTLLKGIALIHNREDKLVLFGGKAPAKAEKHAAKKPHKAAPDVDAGMDEFVINIGGEEAVMRMNVDSYVLKKGSAIKIVRGGNNPSWKLQEEDLASGVLKESGEIAHLTEDKVFDTPSGASKYVRGCSCNGKVVWKTRKGVLLKDYLVSDVE